MNEWICHLKITEIDVDEAVKLIRDNRNRWHIVEGAGNTYETVCRNEPTHAKAVAQLGDRDLRYDFCSFCMDYLKRTETPYDLMVVGPGEDPSGDIRPTPGDRRHVEEEETSPPETEAVASED